ncbi:hypothetical protein VAEU17_4400314 [Vibrio aestuarianus]|nr:hypothetical protein VAEU17_4400314 [Vibrio aestuarianus]
MPHNINTTTTLQIYMFNNCKKKHAIIGGYSALFYLLYSGNYFF